MYKPLTKFCYLNYSCFVPLTSIQDKNMKFNKISALVATALISSAGFTMSAGKANAGASASSTATFNGNVALSCTVSSSFQASKPYTPVTVGSSGEASSVQAEDSAAFDCNSDTVEIAVTPQISKPVPVNATSIVGTHSFVVTGNGTALPNNTGTANANTNVDGDINLVVKSTWTGGEDLFAGNYSAIFPVTVTAK
jgi:hypothetical protein